MRSVFALLFTLVALSAVSACETIGGAGKDISTGGENITDSAASVKKQISN